MGIHNKWTMSALAVAVGMGVAFGDVRAAGEAQDKGNAKADELSMLVKGTVDIAADGSVTSQSLAKADALPANVRAMVTDAIAKWKFEPVLVDGKPVTSRADMSLLLVATESDQDSLQVRLQSANFSDKQEDKRGRIQAVSMRPPGYPASAYNAGVVGTVYLALKIGRDGKVEQVVDEQVNLRNRGKPNVLDKARATLAEASIKQAWKWRFQVPSTGADANQPYWTIRVPVSYFMPKGGSRQPPEYRTGTWVAYVPGPRKPIPWKSTPDPGGTEAMQDGTVYQEGTGPRLLTRLGDS